MGEYNTLQWSRLYGCCFMRKLQICFCFLISDFWPPFCFEIWSKVRCGGDIIWLFWNYFNLTAGMKKGAGLGVFLLSDKRLIAIYRMKSLKSNILLATAAPLESSFFGIWSLLCTHQTDAFPDKFRSKWSDHNLSQILEKAGVKKHSWSSVDWKFRLARESEFCRVTQYVGCNFQLQLIVHFDRSFDYIKTRQKDKRLLCVWIFL